MRRQYNQHGIVSLIKREGRRRGEVDGRTTRAKDAEAVRQKIVNEDKGSEAICSGTMLIAIQLAKANLAKWIEISDAIEKYKQEHPKVKANPKALATLDSYLN